MANIDIIITAKDYATKTLMGIQKQTEWLSKKMDSIFKSVVWISATATAWIVWYWVSSAKALEVTRTSFVNLYWSAEQAWKTIASLVDFANKTPFEMPEIADMALKLKNVAGITDEQLIPTLTRLWDIASSQWKSLTQMTEAFLDATTGEFERLKEFWIKASSAGDQVTFSFRWQTETVAKTAEWIGAYLDKVWEMQGIQGWMMAQSKTLDWLFSTFKDTVWNLTRSLVWMSDTGEIIKGGLLDKMKVGLEQATIWVNTNKQAIIDFWNKIGDLIITIWWYAIEVWKWIIQHKELLKYILEWITILYALNKVIWIITIAVPIVTWTFTALSVATNVLWKALLWLNANPIWVLLIAIWALSAVIYTWYKNWDEMSLTIKYLWEQFTIFIVEKTIALKENILEIWSNIRDWFIWFIDSLVAWITEKIEAVMNFVKEKVEQAKNLMATISSKVSTAYSNVWANVKTVLWLDWTRASWWPVWAWKTYLVWEKWPELFTPSNSWRITANNQLWWNMNININMWWVSVNNSADENRLVDKIKKAFINDAKLYNLWIN
jgi:hypothetical protein